MAIKDYVPDDVDPEEVEPLVNDLLGYVSGYEMADSDSDSDSEEDDDDANLGLHDIIVAEEKGEDKIWDSRRVAN